MTDSGIVVVGGGIAGQAVLEAVRRRDRDVPLTLVCSEARLPYDRAQLWQQSDRALRPAAWYAAAGVRVLLGRRATALGATGHRVRLSDGEVLAYEAVVLCTGVEITPMPGAYALRDPEDLAAICLAAAERPRAVIVGGGPCAVATARALAASGCVVSVIDPGALAAGERVDAPLVICVAARPQIALARSAGLLTDDAIVVDARMCTSAPGVLAVGACARHTADVHTQADAAAAALLGVPAPEAVAA